MKILGIETSCDETAVSIVEAEGGLDSLSFKLLGSAVQSQIEIHKEYGGVVPNLAKREHQKNLPLVLAQALKEAGFEKLGDTSQELWNEKNPNKKFPIDLIAVTVGPGLEPALWAGITFGEKLGKSWGIPVIPANHMEGHIASVLINKTEEFSISNSCLRRQVQFPILALLISGGHTELVLLKSWAEKEKLGETQDDAVGEAFDKVARMLGLPYPGGPEISKLAEEAREKNIHPPTGGEIKFPRPMIHSKDFNFSFSGLKTAVLYYLRSLIPDPSPKEKGEGERESFLISPPLGGGVRGEAFEKVRLTVAREFEDAVIETLISKTKAAIEKSSPKTLVIGGGVIANKALRENFLKLKENYPGVEILIPEKSLTTDNATMIAIAGYIEHSLNKNRDRRLIANGNLEIS